MSSEEGEGDTGLGEPVFGRGHLLFDGAQVSVDARLRGIYQQIEAVGAGFNIPEVLAKIVYQIDEDGFRRRELG